MSYIYDGTELEKNLSAGEPVTDGFTVLLPAGTSVGSYSNGDVIPAGTTLKEIIKNMLQTVITAVYTYPTLGTSFSVTSYPEVGSTMSVNISSNFNQNDGGAIQEYTLEEDATLLADVLNGTAPYSGSKLLSTSDIVYRARAYYAEGPQKTDNLGNPSGTPLSNIVILFPYDIILMCSSGSFH